MKIYSKKYLLIPVLALILSACGSTTRQTKAAPVETREQVSAVSTAASGTQVSAYRPPQQQLAVIRPQPAKAVQVLQRRAADQKRAGDYASAAVSLERGLRIEPRNATLWNRLAHVRAAQKHFTQVAQFAAKSNALVHQNEALKADNWNLIAQARAALGDNSGAARAKAKARVIQ